ncbi:MAG: hypothetical protein KAT77_05300 [Nanoarchaeota archaeon]|nr:hypothetical protein [Nanoarchaeota archaeon]
MQTKTIEERIANLRKYEIKDPQFDSPYRIWKSEDPAIKKLKEVRDESQNAYAAFFPRSLSQTYARAENAVDSLCHALTSGKISPEDYERIVDGTHPKLKEFTDVVRRSDEKIKKYRKLGAIRKIVNFFLELDDLDKVRLNFWR